MMAKVFLHGALGAAFGPEHRLSVHSPAEVVRALITMVPGFSDHVSAGLYQVFRGSVSGGLDCDPQELHLRLRAGEAEVHIVPRAIGAKDGGVGKILLGGLLIAASFIVPGGWAILGKSVSGLIGNLGAAMVVGGVSQVLAPSASAASDVEQPKSDLFGGALNVTTPNSAIPVIAGICEVGSVVVSAAIHVEDRSALSTDVDVGAGSTSVLPA